MFQSRQHQKSSLLDVTLREKHTPAPSQKQQKKTKKEQLMPLHLANMFGLNKILLDNFVFKRNPQKYCIRKVRNTNMIICDQCYNLSSNITTQIQILQIQKHSIPICRLIPKQLISDNIIIYAHGNSSDLVQGIKYIEKVSTYLKMEFIVFDYTGYGCSSIKQISQQSIRQDLQIVIAWLTNRTTLDKIILWGFSLGTYPVTYCASQHKVKGIILQSPIASIGCSFKHNQIDPDTEIENDYLVNLDYIHKIQCEIFIIHSKADQIIPFSHSLALAKKYCKYNNPEKLEFLQINRLQHNQMHMFFATQRQNPLKHQLISFLRRIQHNQYQNITTSNFSKKQTSTNLTTKLPTNPSPIRQPKIKLISQITFPRSIKKIKKQYLEQLRDNIKLAKIPQCNEKQEQLEIQNGVIIRKYTPKVDRCFCLQKC